MLSRSHAISDRDLGALHRGEIRDPIEIRELLSRAAESGTPLRRALNRDIEIFLCRWTPSPCPARLLRKLHL